jgi:hypothetical protein
MQDGTGQGINPRTGTMIIGVVNFLSALIAYVPVKLYGRRPLLVGGHGALAVFLSLVGYFAYIGYGGGVLIMILLQLTVF